MNNKVQKSRLHFKDIAAFLLQGKNKSSRVMAYLGMGLGVLLLLCSVQLYLNINNLVTEKNIRKSGYDYISITKTITNENMGKDNRFNTADIVEIKNQPFIENAAPLISNQFRAKASAGNIMPFSTDLFLESIENAFLDTVPPGFTWKPGQVEVPIIFSSDYLEMYNVFAPAQDLPQLSATTAGAVSIILECYGPFEKMNFRGRIVALSDRINSVLVPKEFLDWANDRFGNLDGLSAARVYIQTKDANDPQLLSFLQEKNYHVNKDKIKFGRLKQVLQSIVTGMGGFAILIILLAMLLFSFYLQLMIARSKENLQLLLTLGYAPGWLSKTFAGKWIPVYAYIILAALIITQVLQYIFSQTVQFSGNTLSPYIHIITVILAAVLFLLCVFFNYRIVKKQLYAL